MNLYGIPIGKSSMMELSLKGKEIFSGEKSIGKTHKVYTLSKFICLLLHCR